MLKSRGCWMYRRYGKPPDVGVLGEIEYNFTGLSLLLS